MQRTTAILVAVVAALCVFAYAVLTIGFGMVPQNAGAAVAAVLLLGLLEVVLDESSI